jgi:tetratricopeptide (TPR) repeat protein
MQTHVRRISIRIFLYVSMIIWPACLAAQDSGSTNGAQPSGSSSEISAASDETNNSTRAVLDYLYNRKPGEGTAAKELFATQAEAKNRVMARDALGDARIEDPLMRERFEKFLGMAAVAQNRLDQYDQQIDRVMKLLRDGETVNAWEQLLALAEYRQIDAGVSWELANRIESIWSADRTSWWLDTQNRQLKKELDSTNRTADMMSERIRDKEYQYQRKLAESGLTGSQTTVRSGGNNGNSVPQVDTQTGSMSNAPSLDSVMGKLELTEEYLKSLELKARIKMNQLKADKLFDKAKNDFADYITTLYKSGRPRHVLIAADFWRRIFDEGDYPVSMAEQVNACLELYQDVFNTVEVFKHRLEINEIAAATDRLQEAFMLSETHPAVLSLKRDDKKRVEAFTRMLSRMQNMLEARDFAQLEETLNTMQEIAPDFDKTKPMAIVNAVKLESQMRLGKARLAAQQGNLQVAMDEFQAAAEAWPGNPDLQNKAMDFFSANDIQNQSLGEFDRLVRDENYRGIFEKQLVFAPAMKDDVARQEQLKYALEKVKKAEMAIEKATLMSANEDVYGAWETVRQAVQDYPEDIKLNAMLADLSGKASVFVAAINKATDAESQGMLGYGLTWYAIAQRHYPASQLANDGIKRLSGEVMEQASL